MAKEPAHEAPARPDARRPRVLVVEDHVASCRSLAKLLDAMGYDVTAVHDGRSAIEAIQAPSTLDYVLTDVQLPDLDGRDVIEAARRLRPGARFALMTGWDFEPDELARLGVEWVFAKPVEIGEIVAKLRQAPPIDPAPDEG
jgi:CheY-like chemotaxis protein